MKSHLHVHHTEIVQLPPNSRFSIHVPRSQEQSIESRRQGTVSTNLFFSGQCSMKPRSNALFNLSMESRECEVLPSQGYQAGIPLQVNIIRLSFFLIIHFCYNLCFRIITYCMLSFNKFENFKFKRFWLVSLHSKN